MKRLVFISLFVYLIVGSARAAPIQDSWVLDSLVNEIMLLRPRPIDRPIDGDYVRTTDYINLGLHQADTNLLSLPSNSLTNAEPWVAQAPNTILGETFKIDIKELDSSRIWAYQISSTIEPGQYYTNRLTAIIGIPK